MSAGRTRGSAWATRLAAFVVALSAPVELANAAVRLCEMSVSSGLVSGSSEHAARRDALTAWKSKAMRHGERYASWRIAIDKLLKCLPRDGGYECLARARPCTIEQAPGRRQPRLGI